MIVLPALAAATSNDPVVGSMPRHKAPALPDDLHHGAVTGPDTLDPAPRIPVLRFAGCTYYPFGFEDGRDGMSLVAYTPAGVIRQRWDRVGARNIWDITVDAVTRTVTFHGHRRSDSREPGAITMTWEELMPLQPIVSRRPKTQLPIVPDDLVYAARLDADWPRESPMCPVLRFGNHTYWPFSFGDGRLAMGIVAYNVAGREKRRWDRFGARHCWRITCDPVARAVSFHGERLKTTREPGIITLPWEELWIG